MENSRYITKIVIDCIPVGGYGSTLTVTDTTISYEYKGSCTRLSNWSYTAKSMKFGFVFKNICELVQELSIPVPNNMQVTIYEFLITCNDDSKFTINNITNHDILDKLLNEIHKLIPEVDGVPLEFDSKSNPKNKVEDLDGDTVNPVLFEDIYGDAPDN